ncbi:hypothetical protein PZH32_02745 [Adlercreutzia equolifaciens]|uniref:hypothetical protein n=1 Tax=Adlercreutzia equolifaciens TaxID=446660 RepID=UPI0023AFFA4E|nr:hypothetical protein [Adlercreutzia equolifaciens]MDE8701876.1 hypothetical protein [Adlercreutzia equolifaciens]
MEDIKASNGTIVTEEMLDEVCAALDSDKWPEGWCNVDEALFAAHPQPAIDSAHLSGS